jgi:single-strand DNA-binding protein|tara:strand:+ start:237 stop:701 length:465 start_codon:yes stop_codon:yes gene_type:complete
MSGSVNKVILLGNLGRDPEIRSMQSGKKMASFSIATSKKWKDRNTQEQKENTSWHNIVVFNEGLVEVIEKYVKKGAKIYVEGELSTRKYQDKDGNERYTTEVVLQGYNSTLTMLGSTNVSSVSESQSTYSNGEVDQIEQSSNSDSSNMDDDIPF